MSGFDKKRSGGQAERCDYAREGMARRRGQRWRDAARSVMVDWGAQERAAAQVWAEAPEMALVDFPPGHKRKCLPGGGGSDPGSALGYARCALQASGEALRDHLDLHVFAAISRTLQADDVLTFAELYTQRLGGKPSE